MKSDRLQRTYFNHHVLKKEKKILAMASSHPDTVLCVSLLIFLCAGALKTSQTDTCVTSPSSSDVDSLSGRGKRSLCSGKRFFLEDERGEKRKQEVDDASSHIDFVYFHDRDETPRHLFQKKKTPKRSSGTDSSGQSLTADTPH